MSRSSPPDAGAWDDWSRVDPFWAVVTDDHRRGRRWSVQEFFASGEATVNELFETASRHGLPRHFRRGLDFGCGPGRLTRAMARRLDHVLGLDVSHGMVELAARHNHDVGNASFMVHSDDGLHAYEDARFDVVCSLLVLQHIPDRALAEHYLAELVRVTTPGGVLFLQIMTGLKSPPLASGLRARLRLRTRLAGRLRRMGASPDLLHRWFHWEPSMPLVAMSEDRVSELIKSAGGWIVWSMRRQVVDDTDLVLIASR